MRISNRVALWLLACSLSVFVHADFDLDHEHQGGLFGKYHGRQGCDGEVLHNGTSTGIIAEYNGESLYISYPKSGQQNTAILYLTDIFGIALLNNRLLADSFARAGYFVVMPDLFRGDPVPTTAMDGIAPEFNLTAWFARHPQSEVEEIIESTIDTMREKFNVSRIGGVGYCFGGKYIARFLAEGRGLEAGFAAHPSNTLETEWGAISAPISLAFGDLDSSNTPENRSNIEAIFKADNKTFQTSLYADAEHGFAVRTNLTDKTKAFAQESAYLQAVRWLDYWMGGDD